MKITFFYAMFRSLGVSYLSAVLKKSGFDVDLVFSEQAVAANTPLAQAVFKSEHTYCNEILATNPDVVAFSSDTDNYLRHLNLARIIKEKAPEIIIVFGGMHPTSVPEYVIAESCVDYICVGEGEEAMPELMLALRDIKSATDIPNIWAKKDGEVYRNKPRPLIANLDDLPFPDTDLFLNKSGTFFTKNCYEILAGRGCYNKCTFCYNSNWRDLYKDISPRYLRFRSVGNVIDELVAAKEKYNIKHVRIWDDIFFYGQEWMDDFLTKYEKYINLPFECNLHSDFVTDELMQKFKKAAGGYVSVTLAAESVDEDTRKEIFDRKETNDSFIKALAVLRRHKIYVFSHIIVYLPVKDEVRQLIETALFFQEHKVDVVGLPPLKYYPNLKITKLAEEKGFLSERQVKEINKGIDVKSFQGEKGRRNKNVITLVIAAGFLPRKILVYLLGKTAFRKDNFLLVFLLGCCFWIKEGIKQLLRPKELSAFYLLMLFLRYEIICLIKKGPGNIITYLKNKN